MCSAVSVVRAVRVGSRLVVFVVVETGIVKVCPSASARAASL
jgi:hypothetical protein